MTAADVDLSRAVSHALRHEPWLYELELDEEGWAPVGQFLAALREKGQDWETVSRADLERMLSTAAKRRHELKGDRIRALYGHSLPGRLRKQPTVPPARLFHGTAPQTWTAVKSSGLLPMGRQFTHLSADRETALAVGRRKSATPVILKVDAAAAAAAGVVFYTAGDPVWLADGVPARYITAASQPANDRFAEVGSDSRNNIRLFCSHSSGDHPVAPGSR
ncbi:MAG: RNA 2'-phosphotransferase [Propionibacteriaceae bacterium]|jgi:putative RNA 2'-phosphotransferase|nr:RNA 2'-phosphotransferase [Propionibacteriaceae bacterium]